MNRSKSAGAIKRRPKSAPRTRTRMKRRKQPRPESDTAALPQSALETSVEMAKAESYGRRRRPKSAHPASRQRNKAIEGTNIFDALPGSGDGRHKIIAGAPGSLRPHKTKGHSSTFTKRPGQKITLLRLKPTCTVNDICGIFGALGLPVGRADVRMTKVKNNHRKAKVYFSRYTEYKQAVQLLSILNGAMDSAASSS